MRSPGIGAQVSGMPTTIGAATTFTGTTTFNKTLVSGAETVITGGVSDDVASAFYIENSTGTAGRFGTQFRGMHGTNVSTYALSMVGEIGAGMDSGAVGVTRFISRLGSSTAITTRPLWDFLNGSTTVLSALPLNSGANLALSWGSQTGANPAFTTRSTGTRLVLKSTIDGSNTDYSIGTDGTSTQWYCIPQASASYLYRWYAGTTSVMALDGVGRLYTTGGQVHKVRIATTTPVTVAASTDYKVVTRLAAAGAVAVNLPAGAAGQVFIIQDGTGDAGANNITITPAAGTINGAATKVIAANYGAVVLEYDGTTWLAR